jgi:D-glutamate cyclase-like protein
MIDQLLAFDPGERGTARFFVTGGAARAARALRRAKRVLLTTGFSVGPGLPETDGPPGAASLGRALRSLGAEVTYVTDAASLPPLQAALGVLGEPARILTFNAGEDAAPAAGRLMAEHAPTHLVAVERPGRTRGGDYLSMRGESVGEWNAALDELFVQAPRRVVTVAVGDGGNEVGMGALRWHLARAGARIRKVASVVPARYPVVAGVSNWGAYGIVVELARLSKRPLLHTAEDERRMVRACVEAGAVDGITRKREATVDALPLEAHAGMVELLRLIQDSTPHGGSTR